MLQMGGSISFLYLRPIDLCLLGLFIAYFSRCGDGEGSSALYEEGIEKGVRFIIIQAEWILQLKGNA